MALATTLTCLTSQLDTLASTYAVVLCVRAQGRIAADAKSVLRCCWRSRRISAFWGPLRGGGDSTWQARAKQKVEGVLVMYDRAKTVYI